MSVQYRMATPCVKSNDEESPEFGGWAWDPELQTAVQEEMDLGLMPGSLRTRVVEARRRGVENPLQAAREALAVGGRETCRPLVRLMPISGSSPETGSATGAARSALVRPAKRVAAERWSRVVSAVSLETFPSTLPAAPYCSDDLTHGLTIRRRSVAVGFKYIQINHLSSRIVALVLDVDRPGATLAWMDAGLPQPNLIVENPENGHAHLTYFLRRPVLAFEKAASKPLDFLKAIQRGYTRRLGADRGYSGMITKNPLHADWRAIWGRTEPFTLQELDRPLDFEDKAPVGSIELEIGLGRNVAVFDRVRHIAYRGCVAFKANGGTLDTWRDHLMAECVTANATFDRPLSVPELRHIAKSIAKWTWRRMTSEKLVARQKLRAARRWKDHDKTEPWVDLGLSRATYYRRKKAGTLPGAPLASAVAGMTYMASVSPRPAMPSVPSQIRPRSDSRHAVYGN